MTDGTPPSPVFNTSRKGTRYPQDGEKIGPAWEAAWRYLCDHPGQDISSTALARVMTEAADIGDGPPRPLLRVPRQLGYLPPPSLMTGAQPRRTAHYRR